MDTKELIEQMRALGGNCAKAADAIESLQAENEKLHQSIAASVLHATNGWARYEQAKSMYVSLADERAILQARINELEAKTQPQAQGSHAWGCRANAFGACTCKVAAPQAQIGDTKRRNEIRNAIGLMKNHDARDNFGNFAVAIQVLEEVLQPQAQGEAFGWVRTVERGPGVYDPLFLKGATKPTGYVSGYLPVYTNPQATPPASAQDHYGDLINALAECRGLVPIPPPDGALNTTWLEAIADPLAVPDLLREYLRQQAGYKLVPVEPTPEMCAAAVKFANGDAVYKNVATAALEIEEGIYGEAYRAMLAASPEVKK